MEKIIKVNFYVSSGCVGAEKETIRYILVPDDYDVEKDEQQIIQDEYNEWMWENIDARWSIIK